MRFGTVVTAAIGLLANTVSASTDAEASDDFINQLNEQAIQNLNTTETAKRSCNLFTAGVRKDWTYLSAKERKAYISAVQCLLAKPSKIDPAFAPGARNRYDDFVAVHINQTLTIHGTGNFLTWHRYFTWAYETALRDECGYTGYQPYWNWFYKPDDPYNNPLFDGSDTSMGSDGAYMEHNGTLASQGNLFVPSGKGGGCVKSGPFKDMELHIGPVSPAMRGLAANPSPDGRLGYNPRCLSRDLSPIVFTKFFTLQNLVNITIGQASNSIGSFQTEFQGRFGDAFLGLHTSGHTGIGGEASDVFSSPNEPTFFLHHAMVDRVYWIWQALHLSKANTIAGTITINNSPASRDALKSDILNMGGVLAMDRPISDLFNTLGDSPLCYIYI
ncbi:hypothetical protein BGZ61DRAFT_421830 [Ilyonectria robusta]|uniref:uncharacterized protein n=1 Tax=Ilyonectria robusta TaxID=1079257 RepID=UPI001E8DA793|nr:uncharacterized protein BGZ61DRAFT_421830 [Ilyonectria robusta]KAH8688549.1 hypothetical protein BGZ61DRAFT_421830 [Ilyonectria robusta]